MSPCPETDHYATLGLDRRCSLAQIRAAYRVLAKRHHPDLNPGDAEAVARVQALNAAHEALCDPVRRRDHDRELADRDGTEPAAPKSRVNRNISQDANVRIEDFIRGVTLEVRVQDPGNPDGAEHYVLVVPPDTAPGARFRLPRVGHCTGGFVQVRLKAMPGFRFKVRGSDLRGDLRINALRAAKGGTEVLPGPGGGLVRVQIPAGVARGEVIRIPREGLPKANGGRGDLLIRVTYRPEVRVTRR